MDDTHIFHLTTVAEQSRAKAALEKAIAAAQESRLLGQEGAPKWSDLVWNLDPLIDRSSAASGRCLIRFQSIKKRGDLNLVEAYPTYWSNVVKLIVVCKIRERFDKKKKFTGGLLSFFSSQTRRFVDTLRAFGVECLTEVTKNHVHDAFKKCGENDNLQSILRNIVNILVACGATPQLSGIELKGKSRNSKRFAASNIGPTSWNDMVALATTYQMLQSNESPYKERNDFDLLRVNMAMANLLACAPSRMSELWRLPFDAAILTNPLQDPEFNATVPKEEQAALDFKFAMTWYPVKGGKPVVKPVPHAMQFVAQRCLEILNDYSERPRKVAKWIMENPGVMPIPDELKELRAYRNIENARIQTDEIKALLGVTNLGTSNLWKKMFKRTRLTKEGSYQYNKVTYCFKTMQDEWWEVFQEKFSQVFKSDWPFVVNSTTLKLTADRALLLFFYGVLSAKDGNVSQLFFTIPNPSSLDTLLGGTESAKKITIWDRLDIRLPGGEAPNINTHEIRHFLNTMAQRAGLPQAVIAMWSGRINIAQNATYDHRTDTERLRAHGYAVSDYDEMQVDDLLNRQVEQLYIGSIGLPAIEVLSAPEGDIRELAKRRIVSITQFGYCVGDLHSDPCPKAVNCLSCARLVTCKGAKNATAFIEQKIKLLEAQKATLELHIQEDDGGWRLGSDRIMPLLEEQIAGAKDLLMTLRDPNLPDGSLVAMGDYRGAQTGSLADRAQTFIAQRKALEAQQKEVPNAEA